MNVFIEKNPSGVTETPAIQLTLQKKSSYKKKSSQAADANVDNPESVETTTAASDAPQSQMSMQSVPFTPATAKPAAEQEESKQWSPKNIKNRLHK